MWENALQTSLWLPLQVDCCFNIIAMLRCQRCSSSANSVPGRLAKTCFSVTYDDLRNTNVSLELDNHKVMADS